MGSNQNGICIKSSTAHLICLGNSRLSTEVTLFEIPIGNITIGNNNNCDIVLKGSGIQDVHCRCSRKASSNNCNNSLEEDLGDVILSPIGNAKVFVEGVLITDDYILQQGDTITLGNDSIFLRFNFPAKAILLKNSAMENSKRSINDNYEVLKKNLNTSSVNFTEFSINADKTLNNNVKITEKMKNLKMKANDSYPKISNLQVFSSSSKSIENCSNTSNNNESLASNNNFDEMQQLEDVLKMFVEYNNNNNNVNGGSSNLSGKNNIGQQSSSDKINVTHQNRIKTNGSLPKNFHTKDHAQNFEFFDQNDSKSTDDIEIYKKPTSPRSPRSPRTRIKTFVSSPTNASPMNILLSPTDNNDKSYVSDKNATTTSSFDSGACSSNEKDYEKLIKSFEEKFRMDIYNIQNCENLTHHGGRSANSSGGSEVQYSSNLTSEKNEILAKIRELKILISDIQYQESESVLDSDVEKSLVTAEMSNEKTNLEILNEKLATIKAKMKQLEIERMKRQKQQEIQQIKLKNIIKDKEAEIKMLQDQKETADVKTRLDELQNSLDVDIKTYEDLEFHYLEEETEWASLMEEYKEDINTFTRQIEDKKSYIHQLEQTNRENENSTQSEQKTLEKKLFTLKQKLENEREKLKNIDKLLSMKRSSIEAVTQSNKIISNSSASNGENRSSSSSFTQSNNQNIITTTKVTTTSDLMSKSFNENMFYNRNKIEMSYFDFSLTTESLPRNSKIAARSSTELNSIVMTAAPKPIEKFNESFDSNNASPLMMPKYQYHSLSSINCSNENIIKGQANDIDNVRNIRIPNGAASSSSSSPLQTTNSAIQHRQQITKQKRPLTRYLPNFSLDFNLRTHIETAGHQIQLCPHVTIDATSCRGYLNKVASKPLFSNLRDLKRWFVFDREKQMFVYYSNKSEKKPRGGAYFSAISDVYFDHSGMQRTFIVKTKSRTFTLQAPSSQACSIWIDVIITGAQAKIFEYEK